MATSRVSAILAMNSVGDRPLAEAGFSIALTNCSISRLERSISFCAAARVVAALLMGGFASFLSSGFPGGLCFRPVLCSLVRT
jgi:hypothetical protein